jgi:uncharacterized protein (TIGR00369 family)
MVRSPLLKNSRLCFGCGKDNDAGLRLEFELRDDGRLETRFTPRDIHGSWEGVFHGGLMATLLDEAMLAYLYLNGKNATTGSLAVRFRRPVRLGEELRVLAWASGGRGRMVEMRSRAERNGETVAEGSARCVVIPGGTGEREPNE